MYSTNFPHFSLEDYERIYGEHRQLWPEYGENKD